MYFIKPYGEGYETPSTLGLHEEVAVLDMPTADPSAYEEIEFFPETFSLWVKLETRFYENDCTIERVIDQTSYGTTHLYKPGYIQGGETEKLKPRSKIHAIDFISLGKGFYLNFYHQMVPFYRDSWLMKNLSKKEGDVLYHKPFAVTSQSLVLQSETRSNGVQYMPGLGEFTYPRYPYGGYSPLRGGLQDIEQTFFYILRQEDGSTEHTALALERTSDYEKRGDAAPHPFTWNGQQGVFINPPTPEEQENVGHAITRGALKLSLTHEGHQLHYASFFYDTVSDEKDKAHIYFEHIP